MRRKRRGTVQVDYVAASAYFSGPPQHQLVPAAQAVNSPYQWSYTREALGVPAQHAADVEAHLVAAGYEITTTLPEVAG